MFQGLKWGIVHLFRTNTFGDTAKIEFAYFTILSSIFVISYKNATIGKTKKFTISSVSHKVFEVEKCTISQFNLWNLLFWPLKCNFTLGVIYLVVESKTFVPFFSHHPLHYD